MSEKIGIVQTVVLGLTFGALLWYSWETRLLRLETAKQVRLVSDQNRLSVLPIVHVVLRRAPDGISLRNDGPTAIRAALQGFQYVGDQAGRWRCTFEPVTMIVSGTEVALIGAIETEPSGGGMPLTAIYSALTQAMKGGRRLKLSLYAQDVLGNTYRSEVEFNASAVAMIMEFGTSRAGVTTRQPTISVPTLVGEFPQTISFADT